MDQEKAERETKRNGDVKCGTEVTAVQRVKLNDTIIELRQLYRSHYEAERNMVIW